jgi:hypothetical protein
VQFQVSENKNNLLKLYENICGLIAGARGANIGTQVAI